MGGSLQLRTGGAPPKQGCERSLGLVASAGDQFLPPLSFSPRARSGLRPLPLLLPPRMTAIQSTAVTPAWAASSAASPAPWVSGILGGRDNSRALGEKELNAPPPPQSWVWGQGCVALAEGAPWWLLPGVPPPWPRAWVGAWSGGWDAAYGAFPWGPARCQAPLCSPSPGGGPPLPLSLSPGFSPCWDSPHNPARATPSPPALGVSQGSLPNHHVAHLQMCHSCRPWCRSWCPAPGWWRTLGMSCSTSCRPAVPKTGPSESSSGSWTPAWASWVSPATGSRTPPWRRYRTTALAPRDSASALLFNPQLRPCLRLGQTHQKSGALSPQRAAGAGGALECRGDPPGMPVQEKPVGSPCSVGAEWTRAAGHELGEQLWVGPVGEGGTNQWGFSFAQRTRLHGERPPRKALGLTRHIRVSSDGPLFWERGFVWGMGGCRSLPAMRCWVAGCVCMCMHVLFAHTSLSIPSPPCRSF